MTKDNKPSVAYQKFISGEDTSYDKSYDGFRQFLIDNPTGAGADDNVVYRSDPDGAVFADALEQSTLDYLAYQGVDHDVAAILASLVPFAAEEHEVGTIARLLVKGTTQAAQASRQVRCEGVETDPLLMFGMPEAVQ